MKITTKILLAFLFILMLSILDTISNYVLSIKVEDNTTFLNNSQEIIRKSGQFQRVILEMQSSLRGFLLSQDSIFLDGYRSGMLASPLLISDLKDLVKDEPHQSALLDSIVFLQDQWIQYAKSIVNAKSLQIENVPNNNYSNLFENSFKKHFGKDLNDQIANRFTSLNNVEYQQREIHFENLSKSIRKTHLFSLSFFGLTLLIGILTTIFVMKFITHRIKAMVELAESISKGNFIKIRDNYKDELSSLSSSMNLMSTNLDKSISQLETRNAELDKFAYVVSHDLKAPLRGIYNVIKWIQEDIGHELSQKMKEYLEIISRRTVRMEQLINGLLEYARLRTEAIAGPTDVHAMVLDLVTELVPKMYQVDLIDLPSIITERIRLEQVLSNLISNAVKFTPASNGRIIISAIQKTDFFEFIVKDNGIGIDPAYHDRIFDIFQTLREKEDEESTGIGLSIVKKILDEHRENIYIISSPGNGSSFTFTWHAKKI